MKSIILSLILIFTNSKPTCLQLDVILLGDLSGSVMGYQSFVSNSFISFVNRFELDEEGLKVGVMVFNDTSHLISSLTANKSTLINEIKDMKGIFPEGNTYLHKGLMGSIQEFVKNGRQGYQKIIILVSDGAIDDYFETESIVKLLNQFNIQIYGVLIKNGTNNPSLMKMISTKYFESDYKDLENTLVKMNMCM